MSRNNLHSEGSVGRVAPVSKAPVAPRSSSFTGKLAGASMSVLAALSAAGCDTGSHNGGGYYYGPGYGYNNNNSDVRGGHPVDAGSSDAGNGGQGGYDAGSNGGSINNGPKNCEAPVRIKMESSNINFNVRQGNAYVIAQGYANPAQSNPVQNQYGQVINTFVEPNLQDMYAEAPAGNIYISGMYLNGGQSHIHTTLPSVKFDANGKASSDNAAFYDLVFHGPHTEQQRDQVMQEAAQLAVNYASMYGNNNPEAIMNAVVNQIKANHTGNETNPPVGVTYVPGIPGKEGDGEDQFIGDDQVINLVIAPLDCK